MTLIKPTIYKQLMSEQYEKRKIILELAKDLGSISGTVGETVSFPRFKQIGDAKLLTKGQGIDLEELEQTESTASIVMASSGVRIYDIDDMTSFGNHVQESAFQQAEVILRKVENDIIEEAIDSPLQSNMADVMEMVESNLIDAMSLLGDNQNSEDMAGIVIHSGLIGSMINMPSFVDATKTHTAIGNGILRNNLLGFWRNIPVYIYDNGTFVDGEAVALIIKKGSLGYMTKRDFKLELDRQAKYQATDSYATKVYATKRLSDSGVVVLRKSNV